MNRVEEIYSILYKDYKYVDSYMDRVMQCKDTDYIPKVENAGEVIMKDEFKCQVMHNGVLIHEGCYHQAWVTDIIKALKGHHEPQEEKLFYEVLNIVPKGGVMVECGSFWSYYSLWFHKEIEEAKNIMIEPMPLKCELGKLNFELNNFDGEFINGYIGNQYNENSTFLDWDGARYDIPSVTIDHLFDKYYLEKIDVLHADIQNNEMTLLNGSINALTNKKIDYLFLGTHSYNAPIVDRLESLGYHIVESFEVWETYFDDGLILACSPNVLDKVDKNKFKVSKK